MVKKIIKHPLGRFYVNILYCLDVLGNVITLGDARETISSVLGKMEQDGCRTCKVFCKFLSFIFNDPDHCRNSILPLGYGTSDNWSPCHGVRRKLQNFYVVILLVLFYYRDYVFGLIMKIT